MAILRQYPTSADTKLSTPYVRELMKKREHLPPLSVPSIDKYERRDRGLQRESTKLIEIQHAVAIILNHGIDDHQAAEILEGVDEVIPHFIEGSHLFARFDLITQRLANICCGDFDRSAPSRTNKR